MTAFVLGLACGNDDLDRGTLWTLRGLPISPSRLLFQKFAVCLAMLMMFFVMAEIVTHAAVLFQVDWPGWLFPTLGDFKDSTFWNFGASLPLSLAQVVCLMMVGLAAGVVFKNFVYSAMAGLAVYVLWYASWKWMFRSLEQSSQVGEFHLAMTGQQLGLCVVAAMLFVRAVKHRDFVAGFRLRRVSSSESVTPRRRLVRLPWSAYRTPYGRRLFLTAILTAAGATVAAVALRFAGASYGEHNDYDGFLWIIVHIPSAILGVSLFSREELFTHTSLIYWQPVSRARLLAERLPSLLVYAVLTSLLPIMFAPGLTLAYYLPLISLCIGMALLGALARLFYRNPMFPLILTMIVACAWVAVFVIVDNRLSGSTESTGVTDRFVQQAWFCAVVIILPLVALKTAFQYNQLLTLRESARSFLGFSVLYCLGLAVCLLIGAQIGELAWLVSHWITSVLGFTKGGAA